MKKVKILSLVLAMVMMVSLAACGSSDDDSSSTSPSGSATSTDTGQTTGEDSSVEDIVSAGVLKVGCKVDVPGFGYQAANGEYEGLEIDLAYEIAAKIFDVTADEAREQNLVQFQGVTAKTRGPLLENGEVDLVIATFTITDERKESYNFSTPYMEDALGLMCLKSSGYESIEDLDGATIGVAQGATTQEQIEAYIEDEGLDIQVEYQQFDGYPALSAALSSDNIDVFSVDRAILAGYVDDTTMILPERFGTQEYGVASALGKDSLAALVDEVINDMLDSGQLDEMIKELGID